MALWNAALRRWSAGVLKGTLVSCLAAAALSGCIGLPQSHAALSDAGEAPYDDRVIGRWYALITETEDPKNDFFWYLQIAPENDAVLKIINVWIPSVLVDEESEPDERTGWFTATAHASEIAGQTYYNVKALAISSDELGEWLESFYRGASGEEAGFLILQANITAEDELFLYFMNPSPVTDLIKKDQVQGRSVNCGEYCDYPLLKASRPELIALIQHLEQEKLFPLGFGPFHRVSQSAGTISSEWFERWMEELK